MNNFIYKSVEEVPEFLMNQVLTSSDINHDDITIDDINCILNNIYSTTEEDWPWKDSGIEECM